MPTDTETTEEQLDSVETAIADENMRLLKDMDGVCATGSTNGYISLRYDGEWQVVQHASGTGVHSSAYVDGAVLSDDEALDWCLSNPVTLEPAATAYQLTDASQSIWDDADEQRVFDDVTRCVWCGMPETTRSIQQVETNHDGRVELCESCQEKWVQSGDIPENNV